MIIALLIAAAAAVPEEADLPAFQPAAERFADAGACRAHLAAVVAAARAARFDAAEGPYRMEAGDVRAHTVRAEGSGHRIAEYRCEAERLSARSWNHRMAAPEEEFTVESVARRTRGFQDRAGQQD
jgi:hypothetical protein